MGTVSHEDYLRYMSARDGVDYASMNETQYWDYMQANRGVQFNGGNPIGPRMPRPSVMYNDYAAMSDSEKTAFADANRAAYEARQGQNNRPSSVIGTPAYNPGYNVVQEENIPDDIIDYRSNTSNVRSPNVYANVNTPQNEVLRGNSQSTYNTPNYSARVEPEIRATNSSSYVNSNDSAVGIVSEAPTEENKYGMESLSMQYKNNAAQASNSVKSVLATNGEVGIRADASKKITWDLDVMGTCCKRLTDASENLAYACTALQRINEAVSGVWDGTAAKVFSQEMLIDMDNTNETVADIVLLSNTLNGVINKYADCEAVVGENMARIVNDLDTIEG